MPHGVTTVTILYDRDGFGLRHARVFLPFVKRLVDALQDNYPERLNVVLLHPINWVMRWIFPAVQKLLSPVTASKVIPLKDKKMFLDYIPAQNLQTRYGGTSNYEFKMTAQDVQADIDASRLYWAKRLDDVKTPKETSSENNATHDGGSPSPTGSTDATAAPADTSASAPASNAAANTTSTEPMPPAYTSNDTEGI